MLPMSFCFSRLPECLKPGNPFFVNCTSRGAVNLIPSTAQRRRWFEIVISGLIIPTYLQFCLTWQRAKPRTLLTNLFVFDDLVHVFFTVVAIWTHVCWTSYSVRTEIQTGSFRYLTFLYLILRAGISSLRGTWASAAWVLSISWWVSSSTELSTG